MKNYIIKAIDKNKSIRIFISDTSNLVQEIRNIHKSSATASAAMGRLATITSIMGYSSLEENQSISVIFDGNGVGGKLRSVAYSNGNVKVSAQNVQIDTPSKYPGKLDVGLYVGKEGNLAVVKDLGLRTPYTGISKLVSGEIAEDIANYYFYSEQTPSIVSLGVLVDTDLSIKVAGGIFVQVLPGISEDELKLLEEIASNLIPITDMLSNGLKPEDILEKYFSKLEPKILDKHEIILECDCSRERLRRGIISLGKEEIKAIIKEVGMAEIECDFCRKKYLFNKDELEEMLLESK